MKHFGQTQNCRFFFNQKVLLTKQLSVPAHSIELLHFLTTLKPTILDWGEACLFNNEAVKSLENKGGYLNIFGYFVLCSHLKKSTCVAFLQFESLIFKLLYESCLRH